MLSVSLADTLHVNLRYLSLLFFVSYPAHSAFAVIKWTILVIAIDNVLLIRIITSSLQIWKLHYVLLLSKVDFLSQPYYSLPTTVSFLLEGMG